MGEGEEGGCAPMNVLQSSVFGTTVSFRYVRPEIAIVAKFVSWEVA